MPYLAHSQRLVILEYLQLGTRIIAPPIDIDKLRKFGCSVVDDCLLVVAHKVLYIEVLTIILAHLCHIVNSERLAIALVGEVAPLNFGALDIEDLEACRYTLLVNLLVTILSRMPSVA